MDNLLNNLDAYSPGLYREIGTTISIYDFSFEGAAKLLQADLVGVEYAVQIGECTVLLIDGDLRAQFLEKPGMFSKFIFGSSTKSKDQTIDLNDLKVLRIFGSGTHLVAHTEDKEIWCEYKGKGYFDIVNEVPLPTPGTTVLDLSVGKTTVATLEKVMVKKSTRSARLLPEISVRTRVVADVLSSNGEKVDGNVQKYDANNRVDGRVITYGEDDEIFILLEDNEQRRKVFSVPDKAHASIKSRSKWGFQNKEVVYATSTDGNPVVYAKTEKFEGLFFCDPTTSKWFPVAIGESGDMFMRPTGGSDFVVASCSTKCIIVPEVTKILQEGEERQKWVQDFATIVPKTQGDGAKAVRVSKVLVCGPHIRVLVEVESESSEDEGEVSEDKDDANRNLGAALEDAV